MSKIIVLGAGMVGSAIALALAGHHDVTAADLRPNGLSDRVRTVVADFADSGALISPSEYVGRAPGCFEYVIQYLRDRNVVYRKQEVWD